MKRQVRDRETLASEIASLSKLDIDELRERWKAMFGKAPSRDISRRAICCPNDTHIARFATHSQSCAARDLGNLRSH